jgi:hypothetical protein
MVDKSYKNPTRDIARPSLLDSKQQKILEQLLTTEKQTMSSRLHKPGTLYSFVRENFSTLSALRENGWTFAEISFRIGLEGFNAPSRLNANFCTYKRRRAARMTRSISSEKHILLAKTNFTADRDPMAGNNFASDGRLAAETNLTTNGSLTTGNNFTVDGSPTGTTGGVEEGPHG